MQIITLNTALGLNKMLRIVFFLFMFWLWGTMFVSGQTPTTKQVQIGSTIPSFRVLLLDGETLVATSSINNNLPTVFIYFSPDCSHCQELTNKLKEHINLFDSLNLCLLSTPAPIKLVQQFAQNNRILEYPQITIGIDLDFYFGKYFGTTTVPFAAIYSRHNKLLAMIEKLERIEQTLEVIAQ